MNVSIRRLVLLVVIGILSLGIFAQADILEMKDGRIVEGRYMGGTRRNVRFLVDGQRQFFRVDQIDALIFEDESTRDNAAPAARVSQPVRSRSRAATAQTLTIPAGTRLLVRMIDGVDSKRNRIGDRFRASLETALTVNGTIVAPKGTDVYGRLTESKSAGRVRGRAELGLELTDIVIGERSYPLMTGEYGERGGSAGTGKKVGGGAALGAVIGAIAGGGSGALKGAAIGGAAGTGVAVATKGQQVRVPSETVLEFTIQQPLSVQVP